MTEFLLCLRSAWMFLSYVPYVDAYDQEDAWTEEDARAYASFMRSATGQKLANRASNLVTKSAVNATRATHKLEHSCGWANGVAAAFTWLDGHKPREEKPEQASDDERAEEFMQQFAT